MVNFEKCYENGQFNVNLFAAQKFNQNPQFAGITYNDDNYHCDVECLSEEIINSIIPNVLHIFYKSWEYTIDDELKENSDIKFKFSSSSSICIETTNYVIYVDNDSIQGWTIGNINNLKSDLKLFWSKFPKQKNEVKESMVKLVAFSSGEYYTIDSKIKSMDIDIDTFYNDDFKPVYNDIMSFLNSRESGLILLYGKMGTGKSSIIRHLCKIHPGNYIIVPTSMTVRLSDPDFITFMMDNTDSIFILEDCEQLLVDRSINMFNGAISNILNMSDGLLSDIMNLKFICTFNADINRIDPALLRKGRCYAKYEFGDLSKDKVGLLNDTYNLGIENIKPMTLAEIFNSDKTSYTEVERHKIGF